MILPSHSPVMWVVLILTVTLSTFLIRATLHAVTSPLRKVPGPWYARLTNLRLKLAVITGKRMYYIHALHQKYGDAVLIAPNEISFADVPSFKIIHAVSGAIYRKAQWYQTLTLMPKAGVFDTPDPRWHGARRRLLARPFSKSSLRENCEPVIRAKVELAVKKIVEEARHGPSDILKWWTFLATDVSGELMFGKSFGMLERGEKDEYITVVTNALIGSGIGSELPWIRTLSRWIPNDAVRKVFNPQEYLIQYGVQAVHNSRSSGNTANVFAGMINKADAGEGGLDELDVCVEASNLIVAGSDTTGITLTYLTWAILKRPALKAELEAELASGLPDDFSEKHLETLPLLNAVIEETLRLYGAAPGSLPRLVPDGGATLAGYALPAGTVVDTQAYTMHRDARLFPDPEKFDPKRWLVEQSQAARSGYSPFGAGSRACIGVHLARMELRLALAIFLRECGPNARLAESTTEESMRMENFFLIAPVSHRCEIEIP